MNSIMAFRLSHMKSEVPNLSRNKRAASGNTTRNINIVLRNAVLSDSSRASK